MSDVDTAVSFTHHKPNVGALLAERAVPQGRTVAPSVTRSQTGGRQCDPTAWALALQVLCDHMLFLGTTTGLKAGCSRDSIAFAGVSDAPFCGRGSDRPPPPRQPIHLVAWRDRPRSRQGWRGQYESAPGRSRHRGVLRRWVSVSNEESLFVVCGARSFSVLWAAYGAACDRSGSG